MPVPTNTTSALEARTQALLAAAPDNPHLLRLIRPVTGRPLTQQQQQQPQQQQHSTSDSQNNAQFMVNLQQVNHPLPSRPHTAHAPSVPPRSRNTHWGGEPMPQRVPTNFSPELPSDFQRDRQVPILVQRHNVTDVHTSQELQAIRTQLSAVRISLERAQLIISLISDTLDTFDLHP
jgi:hypothetical protein